MGLIKNIKTTHLIWEISGEFLHYTEIASLICSIDQMFKTAIDTEPAENFPREMPGTKGYVQIMRAHNQASRRGISRSIRSS